MTINEYLKLVLKSQKLSDDQKVQLSDNRDEIEDLLRDEFVDTPLIRFAGSKAKGTMIKDSYDIDIVCYFPYECDTSIKDIYYDVYEKLSAKYIVEKKKSALRIKITSDGEQKDTHIDVVPGKFTDENNNDSYLYINQGEKERLKTNIKVHIEHVSKSGLRDEIKLLKLWKVKNSINIKTFVLELLAIKILMNSKKDLGENLIKFWDELRNRIDDISIEDPANPTGNDLSNIYNDNVRQSLKLHSENTLNLIQSNGWETLFGNATELQQEIENNKTSLEDFSHKKKLSSLGIKLNLDKMFWAKINSSLYFGLANHRIENRRFKGIFLINSFLPKFHWLKYELKTNVQHPYDVYWQVVNTGEEAKNVENGKGLRGEIFKGDSVRWERSEYKGKHWIEGFVVIGNRCIAKTGPFFVIF